MGLSSLGGTLLGGTNVGGYIAAGDAADAQAAAARRANQTQMDMFNRAIELAAPWRNAGSSALPLIQSFLGIGGGGVTSLPGTTTQGGGALASRFPESDIAPKPSGPGMPSGTPGQAPMSGLESFLNSTGYQFNLRENENALSRMLARSGQLGSGRAQREALNLSTNLAQQGAGNYLQQLMQLAGLGAGPAMQGGQQALQTGSNIGQNQLFAGQARAGGYINQANALSNLVNQGAMLAGYSDRRLKRDIRTVDRMGPLNVYAFKYLWDDTERIGFMADEVEQVVPEAVFEDSRGYKLVNYPKALKAVTYGVA
jgi:hypothetical protein